MNGFLGLVAEILFDEVAGRTTHFLVRRGRGLKRDGLVPVEWIAARDKERILLAVRVEQVEAYADRPPDYAGC